MGGGTPRRHEGAEAERLLLAIEHQKEQEKRATAIERLLARRKAKKPVAAKKSKEACEALR